MGTASAAEIDAKIKQQGDVVRDLKAKKADKAEVKAQVDALLALKAEFKAACGLDWKPGVQVPQDENAAPAGAGDDLGAKIAAQGDKVRALKAAKAPADQVKAEVNALLTLKAEYKTATGQDWKPGAAATPAAKPATKKMPEAKAAGNDKVEKVLQDAATAELDQKIR